MTRSPIPRDAMRGFRCAYCGRQLEELRAWNVRLDRFYCAALCAEADKHALPFAPTDTSREQNP
jgi:hypothetical protein